MICHELHDVRATTATTKSYSKKRAIFGTNWSKEKHEIGSRLGLPLRYNLFYQYVSTTVEIKFVAKRIGLFAFWIRFCKISESIMNRQTHTIKCRDQKGSERAPCNRALATAPMSR